jgi:hypothetical protein
MLLPRCQSWSHWLLRFLMLQQSQSPELLLLQKPMLCWNLQMFLQTRMLLQMLRWFHLLKCCLQKPKQTLKHWLEGLPGADHLGFPPPLRIREGGWKRQGMPVAWEGLEEDWTARRSYQP